MFTIGPVKSLIENSRKAMDMYAGSRLLSELMLEAVMWLEKKENVKILFPQAESKDEKETPNIPNRLVAEFKEYGRRQMEATAKNMAIFVRQDFLQKCSKLLEDVGIDKSGWDMANQQLKDFLEVYWLFEPYENGDYAKVYRKLSHTMQEIKEIRPFSQTREEWGRKCMLFPEYNGIFVKRTLRDGKETYPKHVNPKCICDITENDALRYKVKNNEALSAIGLVKRIYISNKERIYSLRHMLLKNSVPGQLMQTAGISEEKDLGDLLANAVYDLYNGQMPESDEYTETVIKKAEQLYGLVQKNNLTLSSYYALLKFDGDGMGDCFKKLKTIEEQSTLSKKISDFAAKAPGVFKDNGGLPVFAGGEDFFGFLPLGNIFACVRELDESFKEIIGETFSAGITIAHLMQPLKEVIAQVDQMESRAKCLEGKNAVAIGIIKRSGENVTLPAYKLSSSKTQPGWAEIGELVQILRNAECSKMLFFKMASMIDLLFVKNSGNVSDIQMGEILIKKCVEDSFTDDDQIDREELLQRLLSFYKYADCKEDFINTLNGIVFLAREEN